MNVTVKQNTESNLKHGIPVIERAMEVLAVLERNSAGISIQEITRTLELPRSTIYRIMNTLNAYDMTRKKHDGTYVLGPRLVSLASKVDTGFGNEKFVKLAEPVLLKLSAKTGESVKLSVLHEDKVLIISTYLGSSHYSLNPKVGVEFPLHAGAAGKVIFAYLNDELRETFIQNEHEEFTETTITEPAVLRDVLEQIRKQGWAVDEGEHRLSAHAYAAPILNSSNVIVGAASILFLADPQSSARPELLEGVVQAAAKITRLVSRR